MLVVKILFTKTIYKNLSKTEHAVEPKISNDSCCSRSIIYRREEKEEARKNTWRAYSGKHPRTWPKKKRKRIYSSFPRGRAGPKKNPAGTMQQQAKRGLHMSVTLRPAAAQKPRPRSRSRPAWQSYIDITRGAAPKCSHCLQLLFFLPLKILVVFSFFLPNVCMQ